MFQRRHSLSHRKSTSSVHSKHEPMDPEVAQMHAQTAAALAFSRANARSSADGGLSRNNNHHERVQLSRDDGSVVGDGRPVVRRQQSVRFVGPTAIPRRQTLATRASQMSIVPKASNAFLRPRAVTTDAPVPAQYRPPSRSSSIGKASIGKGANASFVTALAYDEYYTNEDDIASTPSSYRKIRKSKSMFSPMKAPSVFYTNGTPDSRFTEDESTIGQTPQNSATSEKTGLRTQKSMSFLRGGRDHLLPGSRQRNDIAVQVARDKYLHEVEQQRLRAQPSFLFRSRKAAQEKPFRQSVRSSSRNGYGNPTVSSHQPTSPKDTGLKSKARRASAKLKIKFQRVFGTSPKNTEEVLIPLQQVEAPRTHVRKYNGDPHPGNNSFFDRSQLDEAAVSRVYSHLPTVHTVVSDQRLRSAAGSVRSMRSEDEKSRVTSWAVSSNNNTISSRTHNETDRFEPQRTLSHTRTQAEADRREQQRLSIINEHGTHHSSATFARRPVTNQSSAYPVIPSHKPSRNAGHIPAPPPGPVDSARLCSALMKRLDENSPQAKLAASRLNSVDSFAKENIPPRSSSIDRHDRSRSHSRSRTPATIRKVPADDARMVVSGGSDGSQGSIQRHSQYTGAEPLYPLQIEEQPNNSSKENRQWAAALSAHGVRGRERDDVFSPDRTSSNESHSVAKADLNQSGPSRKQSVKSHHIGRGTQEQDKIAEEQFLLDQGWTPQEIAIRNEPVIAPRPAGVKKKALRESRSTFFGGSAMTLPRTTSPYRRALAEADFNYNPAVVTGDSPVHTSSPVRNPLLLADETKAPATKISDAEEQRRIYSESIYSRTTSGQTPIASTSNLALPDGYQSMFPLPNAVNVEHLSLEDRQRLYSESLHSKWTRVTINPTNGSANNHLPDTDNKKTIPFRNSKAEDAVIINESVYRPSRPGENQHPVTSSNESTDWQGWMSSQVAVLERPQYNDSTSTIATHQPVNYALPSMPRLYHAGHGHRREHAQINGEDTEVLQQKVGGVKQPLGMLQQSLARTHVAEEEYAAKAVHAMNEACTRDEMPQRNISNFINDLRMQSGPNRPRNPQNNTGGSKHPSPAGALQQQDVPVLKPILKNRSATSLIEPNMTSRSTIPTPPPMPPRSPLRQTQNNSSVGSRTPNSVSTYATPAGSSRTGTRVRNVLHKRNTSQGTLRSAETPAKIGNGSQVTLKSYDNHSIGRKLVKRNGSVGRRTPMGGRENEKYEMGHQEVMDFGDTRTDWENNGREKVDGGFEKLDAQQLGSKRMVDMFLSSRRRRITGSEESAPAGGVFL